MDKFKEIRPVVLGLVRNGNKVLVSEGYDYKKNQKFYRCLGGGIEFLEKSTEALKREFKEELGVDIEVGKYLGIEENIFTYNGKNAHELIFLYNASMKDEDIKEKYEIIDETDSTAYWMDVEDFKTHKEIIYPEIVVDYL